MGKTVIGKAECLHLDITPERSVVEFAVKKPGAKPATDQQGRPVIVASVAIQITFEGDKAKNFFPGKEYKVIIEE